jgi:hypothetical protein
MRKSGCRNERNLTMSTVVKPWTPGERRELERTLTNLWGGQFDKARREQYVTALSALGVPYERVRVALKALARRPPSVEQIVAEIEAHNPELAKA